MESVSNKNEKVWRQRVTLGQSTFTMQPRARLPIQENRRLTGRGKILDPKPPKRRKTLGCEDSIQSLPTNSAKRFAKVKFEGNRGHLALRLWQV